MSMIIVIWSFFEDQFLKMLWLDNLVKKGLISLGIDADSRMGGSIQFFIYDTVKIIVLLSILIFVISYIQSFFPPERTKKILGNFMFFANTFTASLSALSVSSFLSSLSTEGAIRRLYASAAVSSSTGRLMLCSSVTTADRIRCCTASISTLSFIFSFFSFSPRLTASTR